MREFVEPKTIEEAEERRRATVIVFQGIEMELSQINADEPARLKVLERKGESIFQLTKLKEWIRNHRKQISRQVVANGGAIEAVGSRIVDAAQEARNLIQSLRARVEELTSENSSLYRRLQELLANVNQAPGDGREVWRHDETP